jgi:hypothetical protein
MTSQGIHTQYLKKLSSNKKYLWTSYEHINGMDEFDINGVNFGYSLNYG